LLCALVPSIERVRFAKNGADVTQAAVRLARYLTGRQHVFVCGYHGMHDFYIGTTSNDGGILASTKVFSHQLPYGDEARWETLFEVYHARVAGVILEVPPFPWGSEAEGAFLRWLERVTKAHGALFILDEVVTGFRTCVGGAQAWYGLHPDLTCLGKGLANGYPLAALGGPAWAMDPLTDGRVFLSTTNGGECVSLAAAKATLEVLRDTHALVDLHRAGQALGDGLQRLAQQDQLPLTVLGHPSRLVLRWEPVPGVATAAELKTVWIAEHARRGILYGGPTFPMACWGDAEVTQLVAVAAEVSTVMREALHRQTVAALLPGAPLRDVFGARYATPVEVSPCTS
jgi:glutamate-1-semialdehyde 2,1-aminomutase